MSKRKGDATITIIIVVVVILIIAVTYFMFFRNTDNNDTTNMNNAGTNNETNDNQVGIYNDIGNLDNDTNDDITIADTNANEFYQRVKKGITLNGKLIEVPAEYMKRLTNKIGETGYTLSNEAKETVNAKYDEIEKTLNDNKVSDINDLDAATKDKVESLIKDIENAL